ncbi:MAG TPA: hypothetical protein VGL82_22220 [Bryobacteraceae bacterium]|jgi:hypothetical protein
MALTRLERERITDSRLKLQSAARTLNHIDPKKVPDLDEIQDCLEDAEESLRTSLRSSKSERT